MCRFVAYLGRPVTLQSLLVDPSHSLLRQSWAPRHQDPGVVNADGFGVGWYDTARRPEPAVHRTTRPMWGDQSFASWSGLVATGAVLGVVRSATPPAPLEESGTAPFAADQWLFAHNGAIDGFRGPAGGRLRRLVSDRRTAGIRSASDSEVVFALVLDQLDAGANAAEALTAATATVLGATTGRLNLVLTDGHAIHATACGHSLFVLQGMGSAGEGAVVASEPHHDHPDWRRVRDGSLVMATAEQVTVTALPGI